MQKSHLSIAAKSKASLNASLLPREKIFLPLTKTDAWLTSILRFGLRINK